MTGGPLSPEDIGALLAASEAEPLASPAGPAPGRNIVVYDFKHPNRISKDQIRTLESIHNHFSGKLASALSGMLRSVADVDLVRVDQITYSEFIGSLVAPSCTYTFAMQPLEGLCVADFSPALTFAFVDRMFGGRGQALAAERELTGIEISVMDKIVRRACRELGDSWGRLAEFEIVPVAVETTPQFIQIVPPSETVIVTTLQLKMLEITGIMSLCYPYLTLEPVVAKMSGQNWIEATKGRSSGGDHLLIQEGLRQVDSEVTAVVAKTALSMRDFLGIRVGDIIVTETKTLVPARVLIGGVPKFTARPGMAGRRRAVEIVDAIQEMPK